VDEVGLLTVEERYPWVASKGQCQTGNGRRSWRLKNQVARALVDQDQLEDSCFQVFEDSETSAAMWSHLHHGNQLSFGPGGGSNSLISEAEDAVSSPTHSLIFNQATTAATSSVTNNHSGKASATPAVDFPFQFNFGSIYSSSLTIYFDN